MPIITAYVGASEITFGIFENAKNYNFYSIPFAYSGSIYREFLTEENFYDQILSKFAVEENLDLSRADLYFSSFYKEPQISKNFPIKKWLDITDVIKSTSFNYVYLLDNNHAVSPVGHLYSESFSHGIGTKEVEYLSNFRVYKLRQGMPTYLFEYYDENIKSALFDSSLNTGLDTLPYENKVIFTGARFELKKSSDRGNFSKYYIMCDLINWSECIELYVDTKNIYANIQLLKLFDPMLYDVILGDLSYDRLGVLINTYGAAECLIKSQDETYQIVDAQEDDLSVLPIDANELVEITVKGKNGTKIYKVKGGSIGIIIDSRNKKAKSYLEPQVNNKFWTNGRVLIEEALNKV